MVMRFCPAGLRAVLSADRWLAYAGPGIWAAHGPGLFQAVRQLRARLIGCVSELALSQAGRRRKRMGGAFLACGCNNRLLSGSGVQAANTQGSISPFSPWRQTQPLHRPLAPAAYRRDADGRRDNPKAAARDTLDTTRP
jgi:hypothetical protein